MLVERKLSEPTPEVLVTISEPNYVTDKKGVVTLKNSARMRVYMDKNLLVNLGYTHEHLKLIKIDESIMGLVFEIGDKGSKISPIKKGSGKSEVSIPMSKLDSLKPADFPAMRRAMCSYRIKGDRMAILLPLGKSGA